MSGGPYCSKHGNSRKDSVSWILTSFSKAILVSQGFHNKLSQIVWLKTIDINCLVVLDAGIASLKSKVWGHRRSTAKFALKHIVESFLASFALLTVCQLLLAPLTCRYITPIGASVFTWPTPSVSQSLCRPMAIFLSDHQSYWIRDLPYYSMT